MSWTDRWSKRWELPSQTADEARHSLQRFALEMSLVLIVMAIILFRRGYPVVAHSSLWIMLLLAVMGRFAPLSVARVRNVWLGFGERISGVVTLVIMAIVYYLMVTPLGIVRRFIIRDPMELKFDSKRDSYWTAVDEGGSSNRPYAPY